MDDLMSKLQSVLNDKESMQQIQELANMFGSEMSNGNSGENSSAVPINNQNNQNNQNDSNQGALNGDLGKMLSGLLGGNNNNSNQNNNNNPPQENNSSPDLSQLMSGLSSMMNGDNGGKNGQNNAPGGLDMMKLLQIQNIMSQVNKSDKNVDLLMALRPLLKDESQMKIDKIIKIFKFFAIYPALKESGLLGGDLFGLL